MQTRGMDLFQVAQHVDDLPRARAFYERLLNAPPVGIFDLPTMAFFQAGPVRLLLEYGATSALTYLRVDDVHATIESLRADDVEIVTERYVIFRHSDDSLGPAGTDEWLSFVRDSEGNLLGLVSHQTPRTRAWWFGDLCGHRAVAVAIMITGKCA
jgi:methylmalonyl-CoA/ethylmalonyl-CoA epimerase